MGVGQGASDACLMLLFFVLLESGCVGIEVGRRLLGVPAQNPSAAVEGHLDWSAQVQKPLNFIAINMPS